MNRLLLRDSEFGKLSRASLRKQLSYWLDTLIDKRSIRIPTVDDTLLSVFLATQSGIRTTVVVDDSAVVRVLGNSSVQWIDAQVSKEARQRAEEISNAVDRLIASAKDYDGSSTVYPVYSRLFEQSRRGVSR